MAQREISKGVNYKSHQKIVAYFSHSASSSCLLKGKVKKREAWHNAPLPLPPEYAPDKVLPNKVIQTSVGQHFILNISQNTLQNFDHLLNHENCHHLTF